MLFYLGTHEPSWLRDIGVPLFVSDRRLRRLRTLPQAGERWALDSGGFTELSTRGRWETTPGEYVARARRYRDEVGRMDFAAPQDWMCEPAVRELTGLSVRDHQERTIASVMELRATAPDVPWIPVLQGWDATDYLTHIDDYTRAGIDLRAEPTVGVGTVCRRQSGPEGAAIVRMIADRGIRIHAFGFKLTGLAACHSRLVSADSMAWSYSARKNPPLPGCGHASCANCRRYAMMWRNKAIAALGPAQYRMFT